VYYDLPSAENTVADDLARLFFLLIGNCVLKSESNLGNFIRLRFVWARPQRLRGAKLAELDPL
jgi:hypothetical protein